ncbi:MAG TPA: hypothetical protein VFU21_25050 [Kofleriaceae bacterium]|nr:hypothetical protein [Kofleriaceae bacterium]
MRRELCAAVWLAACIASASASPHTAVAEPTRPWRGGIGAGGSAMLLGPVATGLVADAALKPGGAFGRVGARAEARTIDGDLGDGIDGGLLLGGVVYEAAAARPRLAIDLHGDAGVALPDARLVLGGGGTTQLWLAGPLAIGLDSSAHVILDGVDGTELILAGSLTVRVGR